MAKVELKDLTKIYGSNTVVDHINLEVEDGTLVSILGPSGCGKTTTLRMIAGFEMPEEGDVLFDGQSVGKVAVNKRNIGMVFQSYALFPHMTVAQNVSYGLEQHGVSKQEIPGRCRRRWRWFTLKNTRSASRSSFPGASSSVWRWPGHWSSVPGCFFWTNVCRRWTKSCAWRCRASCAGSWRRPA